MEKYVLDGTKFKKKTNQTIRGKKESYANKYSLDMNWQCLSNHWYERQTISQYALCIQINIEQYDKKNNNTSNIKQIS